MATLPSSPLNRARCTCTGPPRVHSARRRRWTARCARYAPRTCAMEPEPSGSCSTSSKTCAQWRGELSETGHRSFAVITKAGAESGASAGSGVDLGEVVDAVRLPELLFGVRPRVVGHRTGTRRVQLVRGDGRDVSTLYGWLGTELRPRAQNGSALHASPHGAVFFLSWKGAASRKGALPGRAGPQGGGGGGAGGGPVCLFRSHPALSSLVVVWRGGGGAGGAGPRGNGCTVGTRVGATVGGGEGTGARDLCREESAVHISCGNMSGRVAAHCPRAARRHRARRVRAGALWTMCREKCWVSKLVAGAALPVRGGQGRKPGPT